MNKILVVDDMAIFRQPIAATLRREGYDVICAGDGREALEAVHRQAPDLILLDLALPVMDGLTCLAALRQDPRTRHIPVIALTAMAEREAIKRAVNIGVQGYLLKSQFSLDDLLEHVRKALPPGNDASTKSQAPTPPGHSRESGSAKRAVADDSPPRPPPLSEAETLGQIRREANLRAVPTVLHHVLSLTRSNSSSFADVASAVRKDHALAVKVMRVANSSLFRTSKSVQSLAEAAQRIGMSGVRNAIASIVTIEHFGSASTGGLAPQRFWEHSLATAALADLAGQAVGMQDADHLFLAGLLHDLGRLVLSTVFPTHCEWVLQSGAQRNVDLVVVEREVFGLGHDDVTKELLTQWQTPEDIREAASAHHLAVEQIQRTTRDSQSALIVALADRLAHALVLGDSGNSMLLPIRDHTKSLGLEAESVRSIARQAVEKTQETEIFYASRADQDLCQPLANELVREVDDRIRLAVLAGAAPGDALSLFCEQLGWLDSVKPHLAVLYVGSAPQLSARFNELQQLESALGAKLGVLIASPDGSVTAPLDLLQGRCWATVQLPSRYTHIVEAIVKLHKNLAPEPVSVQP